MMRFTIKLTSYRSGSLFVITLHACEQDHLDRHARILVCVYRYYNRQQISCNASTAYGLFDRSRGREFNSYTKKGNVYIVHCSMQVAVGDRWSFSFFTEFCLLHGPTMGNCVLGSMPFTTKTRYASTVVRFPRASTSKSNVVHSFSILFSSKHQGGYIVKTV
jgi:hypothetical protein